LQIAKKKKRLENCRAVRNVKDECPSKEEVLNRCVAQSILSGFSLSSFLKMRYITIGNSQLAINYFNYILDDFSYKLRLKVDLSGDNFCKICKWHKS
jgi:hypothetical protein